jgi:hypothetical protein
MNKIAYFYIATLKTAPNRRSVGECLLTLHLRAEASAQRSGSLGVKRSALLWEARRK